MILVIFTLLALLFLAYYIFYFYFAFSKQQAQNLAAIPNMQRISIVGMSGSGKSTLSSQLCELYPSMKHVELDALHHGPNWTPQPFFAQQVQQHTTEQSYWVTDGNYRKVRRGIWQNATTIVWLDYSLAVVFPRLLWRTLKRLVQQHELWNGNRESWYSQFCTSESLLLFALRHHFSKAREIEQASKECKKQQLVRLCSPAETETWLEQVRQMQK